MVSGGSSGIGWAIASYLGDAGVTVMVADVRPLPEAQANIHYQKTDLTKAADVEKLFGATIETIGEPDLVVVSAGRGVTERLDEGDPANWEQVLALNVMGALRVVRAFVPAMVTAGRGDVVVISSVSAGKPHAWGGVYGASKTALSHLAETLRLEVQPAVRVLTVAPGVVDTPFFERRIGGGDRPEDLGWGALEPSDVAEVVVFALTRRAEVAINEIVIRPAPQSF